MIPFNRPYMTGNELERIAQAHTNGHLSGDGPFTQQCHRWLQTHTQAARALLTHSCTAALEMAALLLDLAPGDEVIMPSYTFVSTANAFALRGAIPVFVDIREDTLNLDERLIESAITSRTRAICVVHYAGISCEMDTILSIAKKHNLKVIEDAAQAIFSTYKGCPLGSIGELGCLSFHETKNIICGEGGALLLRDNTYVERAEIIREKGTNRSRFFRGQVDKYTWVDRGSSYLPSELVAAFLSAQMDAGEQITAQRMTIWNHYHSWAKQYEIQGRLRRPVIPDHCTHNAHMYYIVLPNATQRDAFIQRMKERGITTVFHYIPLHSAPAGLQFGRATGQLDITNTISERIVRLPLWLGLNMDEVLTAAEEALSSIEHLH